MRIVALFLVHVTVIFADGINPDSGQKEISREENIFRFTVEKPAIVSAEGGYYGNSSGRCREFVPIIMRVAGPAPVQEIQAIFAEPAPAAKKTGLCRAMPQTIGHGKLRIEPGSYRLENPSIKRVTLFFGR